MGNHRRFAAAAILVLFAIVAEPESAEREDWTRWQ
jgi:hypothetical protein